MNKQAVWIVVFGACLGLPLRAQTGISGSAPVSIVPGALDCGGSCIRAVIRVDLSSLTGNGGTAGLNVFALSFSLDRDDVFASALPGASIQDWVFQATSRDRVDSTDLLTLVGVLADPNAPDDLYEVAEVILCGSAGDATLTLDLAQSSLGSRLVNGDGPGPITPQATLPGTVTIPINFPLVYADGLTAWRTVNTTYDLADPMWLIDILDLTKLVNCGVP